MPYIPRAPVSASCAHCGTTFSSSHLRRKYCCNSCNVLAAQARKKAELRRVEQLPAAPPTECVLPERFLEGVGSVRAMNVPRRMDPIEATGYRIGSDYWIQGYQSDMRINWLATQRWEVYQTSAFWVSATGHVWVRGDSGMVGKFIHVNQIVAPGTSAHFSEWGPFHGREPSSLDWE